MKKTILTAVMTGMFLAVSACGTTAVEKDMKALGLDPGDYSNIDQVAATNSNVYCPRPVNANLINNLAQRPDRQSVRYMLAIIHTTCPKTFDIVAPQVAMEDPGLEADLKSAGWIS